MLALLLLLVGCHETPRSEVEIPQEPPVTCTFNRGAWCLLTNSFGLSSEQRDPETDRWVWQISEPFWSDEPGYILENKNCKDRLATGANIRRMPDIEWRDSKWRVVRVALTKDCSLELLAPLREEVKLDMAASAIATHLAICIAGTECEKTLVAAEIFAKFKESAPQRHQR
ncbi:hypothetical protein GCM10027266_15810 [Arenimonas alkanexedens]